MARRIRKQCYELSPDDFDRFPCWEYALDEEGLPGQDEATVRPAKLERGIAAASGPLFVLAVFSFSNGRIRLGTLTIGAGLDVSGTQPAMFLKGRLLQFYLGAFPPTKAALKAETRLLTAISDSPFPVYYCSALRDRRGRPLVDGVLKGFYKHGGFGKPAKRLVVA